MVSEVYDVTPEEVATPPQAIRLSLEQVTSLVMIGYGISLCVGMRQVLRISPDSPMF